MTTERSKNKKLALLFACVLGLATVAAGAYLGRQVLIAYKTANEDADV